MGCSYDPSPYEYTPSPAEQWMKDNKFSHLKHGISYCHECGICIYGNKHGNKLLKLHLTSCSLNPRNEIFERTQEDLKENFTETRWV